jgi:hypothetical protein
MALFGPNDLPTKVISEPVEGWALENSANVLPSSAMAMAAATTVSGEATPAVVAMRLKPK